MNDIMCALRLPAASRIALLAFSLMAAAAASLSAADFSWDSTSDGDWSALANWSGAGWVPGSDFPANVDTVTLGSGGFLPFSGLQAQTRTITLGTGEVYTVGSLTFSPGASASPQNYLITGPGKLVFDSGTSAPTVLSFGAIYAKPKVNNPDGTELTPTIAPLPHEIAADIEIKGALNVTLATVGYSTARTPVISGNISRNGSAPIHLKVGGGVSTALGTDRFTLQLKGTDFDFNDGELEITDHARVKIFEPDTLKGATIRLTGGDSLAKGIQVNSGYAPTDEDPRNTGTSITYAFKEMIVEGSGAISIGNSNGNNTVNWQSTRIAASKTLTISAGDRTDFVFAPSATLSIGNGSTLVINQNKKNRFLRVHIGNQALLEGNGLITTQGSKDPAVTGDLHSLQISSGGTVDPGIGAGKTGILTFGTSATPETRILFNAGSTLRMQLNGLTPGLEHDQLVADAGFFTLTETGAGITLSLSVNYQYQPEDEITLINVAGTDTDPGVLFTGTFAGLGEGALVNMGFWGGNPATAQISYLGGDGNDVILYNFSVVPEPGTYALMGFGLAALLLWRRKTGRIATTPHPFPQSR